MTSENNSIIAAAKTATKSVYERQARVWDQQRLRNLYEKVWLDPFIASLSAKGRILDLGCGSGDPVAGYFLQNGFELVGVDYADAMVNMARARYPDATWHVSDMRTLPDLGRFDGIYSWDGFFHLSVNEQRAALPRLAKMINTGGSILLTVGHGEGEVTGIVGGETVYHASLSPDEYEAILQGAGFSKTVFKADDPDCLGRSVILATGIRQSS